ncbi:glycoside hydrolase family 16 protein [Microbacterium phosphatis]|uniref:glycoside hydrolase family 16 protein n=1 Tax=Microbacterium phosphatis TaxID=3140248 RepID=UPI003140260B
MKHFRSALALTLIGGLIALTPTAAHAAETPAPGWAVAYDTTFPAEDLAMTRILNQPAWKNGEIQRYATSQVAPLEGGGMRLRAEKVGTEWLSGGVEMRNVIIKPGSYVTASIKLPEGQGFWPAFWMWNTVGGRNTSEIDIVEAASPWWNEAVSSVHGAKKTGLASIVTRTDGSWADEVHDYAVWWERDVVSFWIDGVQVGRYAGKNIPTDDMFAVFNIAIGGAWPGLPDSTTPSPADMVVEDFAVYTHGSARPAAPPV